MKQETVVIKEGNSERLESTNIIISVRHTYGSKSEIVVGSPGLPNVNEEFLVGDALLFETPNDGVFELRALSMDTQQIEILISQVSPRLGIVGGFVDDDPNNTPFTPDELGKISESIKKLSADIKKTQKFTSEQLNLIDRKLIEIEDASQRLGRKDWINYVAGTLTTVCVSAAFAPDTSKALFKAVNTAFRWLFDNAILLLS
ncbi:hypothetical protein [uncultured Desulfosarcina sp.]|uniref:hypothetical protein n=1 Tax=uncultured Desulfosarcina sp. TaxID=218289 RepID=UPI0029C89E54|nr:hypothetical protein [uncultured Desulfosarcina sp.]